MAEGQTATNPQTGERIVLRGGQWVPMGGGQPAARPQARQAYTPQYNGPMPTSADALFPSLIAQESGGRAGVRGPMTQYGQALGRTQVLPSTARGIARNLGIPYREDLLTGTTPEAAAYQDQLGRAYLDEGFQKTGNAREALMYYHGGPDRSLWGPKTQRYADEVLQRASQGGGVAPVSGEASFASMPQQAAQPAIQTATNPQTGEKMQLVDGQWQPMQTNGLVGEIEIDTPGIRTLGGKTQIYDAASGAYYDATPEQVNEYQASLRRSQADRQARVERQADPEYQAAFADAQRGSENVPDQLRAIGLGGTLGFLTDINAEAQGLLQGLENAGRNVAGQEIRYGADMARQAARDAVRDDQAAYAAEKPIQNFALQLAGGLVTPGIGQAGRFIESAQGAARLGRAAGVGGGIGIASGVGNSEGNLVERVPDAISSGLVGAGTGVIGQRAVDAIGSGIAGQGGGAARRLSRAGVDLTPGQMVSETPGVGQFVRNLEDVAGGFNPLMGGVRQRQNQQVVRAAGNEALAPIGETLPRDTRTGYQVAQRVSKILGDRYDDVTSGITARIDPQFNQDLSALRARAGTILDDANMGRLDRILRDKVEGEIDPNGTLSGANFKRIETALREQSERASRPTSTLADNDLAEVIDESRDVVRDLIARQYPEAAEEIRNLNLGWANYKRIERAVTGSAGFSREGTPTPGEVSQTVANMSSNSQIANERALLQGLATDARTVLPSTVPDSGTAQKTVLAASAGALGTGAVAAFNPALAGMIATGAIVYSRPGIATLNALYRATDSRAANEIVRQLAQQAQENPALLPYYEAAVQHVGGLSQRDTQAAPQAPPSTPVPSAALQRVMQ